MRRRNAAWLLLAAGLLGLLPGCGVAEEPEESAATIAGQPVGDPVEKVEPMEIGDVHLRDKDLLYEMQDPTEVVTMYLTVSRGNGPEGTDHSWEEVNTYSVYYYEDLGIDRYQVAGLLQVGDENGPVVGELGYGQSAPNCTVQVRGQTSSRNPQKNYKVRMKDNKGTWNGQQTIALNKHVSDGLRFRNKLAYDLMAGIDEMMGLRTTFVHLYVKDTTAGKTQFEDYGLYTQVEQLNKTALKAHGLHKDGHLYKVEFFEFLRYPEALVLADDPAYDLRTFESHLEVKGDSDHSKLLEMLDVLNDLSNPIDPILEEYFDVENLSYWLAFHILLGNKDTQSRNCYLYSPLNSKKWYFYSWDNDVSLKKAEDAIRNRSEGGAWEIGVSNYWGNALFRRALKSAKFRAALDAAVEDIYAYLTPERVNGMARRYAEVVKPYAFSMPDLQYLSVTESEYEQILDSLYPEICQNYADYWHSYERPMPFYIGVPESTADGIEYAWENSYDFDAENITYSFQLARDYEFREVLLQADHLVIPSIRGEKLPAGQYFIRVVATNESGESQYAFDYYLIESGKVYGAKCFYVEADGTIVEDIYVEG